MRGKVFDIAVIGSGIAGASAAAALAPHASVALIEAEPHPGYHSTGRSAAILAQTYGSDVVRCLTKASDAFLRSPPKDIIPDPLLTPRTLLRIARADQVDQLRAMYEELEYTDILRWIDADEIECRVPLLRSGYAAAGFLNAHAQDMDVHGLLQGYLRRFRQCNGSYFGGARVTGVTPETGGWRITTANDQIAAGVVVNAAGAWADEIAALAGVDPIGFRPLRRSALTFDPPTGVDTAELPMIVDAEELFYLKPETGKLLASPADQTVSPACDSQPEELDIAICVDRIITAFDVHIRKIDAKWSGLRTFSPDDNPVCGFDGGVDGFFWLAGQGGFGIQTAPAMSDLTAHQICDVPLGPNFADSGVNLADLSPGRFANKTSENVTKTGS